ncbi:hypothetical protein XFF6992_140216 [Xanthomonas citri pv. fuscans]|nr:hypothetical protein XFF6992_140216 [Xanthomonas citri pv. fuscans]SOO36037.1 hypothetical protein XFF6994_740016 [Xanthomonas citri pv. fuscans]
MLGSGAAQAGASCAPEPGGLPTTEHAAASRLGRSLRVAARTEIKPCLEFSRRNRLSQR